MKSLFHHVTRLIVLILCCLWAGTAESRANDQRRVHTVYFEDTDYELHVYRIHGDAPGKTLMIIGGIQGDEPVGYLAADLFVDFFLARGNLIVVPRANFHSIMLNRRQINEDMNRKFAEDARETYETKVVDILKQLMAESDCLLNLHEGSGFYSETWEGPYRNPLRFGQCIIADTETYTVPETGVPIDLGGMARTVIEGMNKHIRNPDHRFRFNNHRTEATDSLHKVQRKSATYYALYTCGIPAFGIEAGKSLPLETKVRHHRLAIKGFMDILGIVPEMPGVHLDPPRLRYAVVSINDDPPLLVSDQQTLFIKPGDEVTVAHVEANYERGLSADIIDYGTVNDLRKRLTIHKPTSIVIRKDYQPFGNIYLAMDDEFPSSQAPVAMEEEQPHDTPLFFSLRINGVEKLFRNNEHAALIRGDRLEILDVIWGNVKSSDLTVNFKGFVGNPSDNTGEDRGYIIDTGGDLLTRFSVNRDGRTYPIVVTDKEKRQVGILFIELEEPAVKYAVFRFGGREKRCYQPGEIIPLRNGNPPAFIDLITNVPDNRDVEAVLKDAGNLERIIMFDDLLDLSGKCGPPEHDGVRCRIEFRRRHVPMGAMPLTSE